MFFTYTVTVTKDVTEPVADDEPFYVHQVVTTTTPDGTELRRIVVRFRRFHRLRNALGTYRYWRTIAKGDRRFGVAFRVGAIGSITAELPVPAAVSAIRPPARRSPRQ